jgi:predicted nucleic acid-binding protein
VGLLIDSSVLIRLERDEASLDDFIVGLGDEDVAIASITASELLVGVLKASPAIRRSHREAFVEYVVGRFPVLPVDLAVARTHARLLTDLQAASSMIGLHDLLIAATAVANELAILTFNVREFNHVPGLDVRTPVS